MWSRQVRRVDNDKETWRSNDRDYDHDNEGGGAAAAAADDDDDDDDDVCLQKHSYQYLGIMMWHFIILLLTLRCFENVIITVDILLL